MSRSTEPELPAMLPQDEQKACPLSVLPPGVLTIIRALPHSDRLTVTLVCKQVDHLARSPGAGLVSFSYAPGDACKHEDFLPFVRFLRRWGRIVGHVTMDMRKWSERGFEVQCMPWASTVQMLCSLQRLVDITWISGFGEQNRGEQALFQALLESMGSRVRKIEMRNPGMRITPIHRFFVRSIWEHCTALKRMAAYEMKIPSADGYNIKHVTSVDLVNCTIDMPVL